MLHCEYQGLTILGSERYSPAQLHLGQTNAHIYIYVYIDTHTYLYVHTHTATMDLQSYICKRCGQSNIKLKTRKTLRFSFGIGQLERSWKRHQTMRATFLHVLSKCFHSKRSKSNYNRTTGTINENNTSKNFTVKR